MISHGTAITTTCPERHTHCCFVIGPSHLKHLKVLQAVGVHAALLLSSRCA